MILTGIAKSDKIKEAESKIVQMAALGEDITRDGQNPGGQYPDTSTIQIPTLSLEKKLSARSFMDWLLPLLPKLPVKKIHFHQLEGEFLREEKKVDTHSLEDYMRQEEMQLDISPLKQAFSFEYPYREASGWKRKYSVSELKKLSMMPMEGEMFPAEEIIATEKDLVPEQEEEVPKPRFLSDTEPEVSGAARGTIVHKIMELLPFGEIQTKKELFEALQNIEKSYADCSRISMKTVYRGVEQFLFSEVGEKIREMDREGKLRKELPFTAGLSSALFYSDAANEKKVSGSADGSVDSVCRQEEEMIVVQGIIDACGEDEEGLWLFDYKTDYVSEGEESLLLDRYKTQMLYYKSALEQILGKKVIHSYIYSFSLGKYLEIYWQEVMTGV